MFAQFKSQPQIRKKCKKSEKQRCRTRGQAKIAHAGRQASAPLRRRATAPKIAPTARRCCTLGFYGYRRAYACHAAVSTHQGPASERPSVLPHGRFLRAVLRRCQGGGASARHHSDGAGKIRRGADSHGRSAVSRHRRLFGEIGGTRPHGGHLRASGRPQHRQRARGAAGGARGHPRHHRRGRFACAGPGERARRRQPVRRRLGRCVAEPRVRRVRGGPCARRRRAGGPFRPHAPGRSAGARKQRPAAGRAHLAAGSARVRRRFGAATLDRALRCGRSRRVRPSRVEPGGGRGLRGAALRASRPLSGSRVRGQTRQSVRK